MIYVPPKIDGRSFEKSFFKFKDDYLGQVYSQQENQDQKFRNQIDRSLAVQLAQQEIYLENNVLVDLNYGDIMHGLKELVPTFENRVTSRGIVLNVQSFQGPIRLSNNTISANHAFIPSAFMNNLMKLSGDEQVVRLDDFKSFNNSLMFENENFYGQKYLFNEYDE